MDRVRILIAGGGTGGHLYPALAIARELQSRIEGCDVLMAGTSRGLEARVVPEEGLPLATIPVAGLKGKGFVGAALSAARLPLAMAASWRLLGSFRPRVVVGVGGYASGPVLAAAVLRGRPTLIHEQNMIPGSTNRWLAAYVSEVAVSFEETRGRLGGRGIVTGNPVRPGFASIPPRESHRGLAERRLLVFGGSQGASAINAAMIGAAPRLSGMPNPPEILHQTGPDGTGPVEEAYRNAGLRAEVRPYIEEMARAMDCADLVVARAGATTVAELTAAGRGSILIPFPRAIHDHQTLNARALEVKGAAVLLPQNALDPDGLGGLLAEILADDDRLDAMGRAARSMGRPEATGVIAELVMGLMSPPAGEARR